MKTEANGSHLVLQTELKRGTKPHILQFSPDDIHLFRCRSAQRSNHPLEFITQGVVRYLWVLLPEIHHSEIIRLQITPIVFLSIKIWI